MQITKIEEAGKKRRIYLNDEPAFLLYPSEVRTYKLAEGQELDEQLQERIYTEVLVKRARLRCMNILKTADKTEYQLRQKLTQDGYPQEIADDAIEYVRSYHYIDDLRYARNYIGGRAGVKSKAQLKADLLSRGVPSDLADQALEDLGEDAEKEKIRTWMQKKHLDPESASREEIEAFVRFLMRKGFSYGQVKNALTDIF